ncbi:amidase signature domain-containing protein [Stachybotrys elegans]|uniref:Amidase signature domain-containing protein n=1 Tax=Stachybotrys elegans TaxID=80388 RepID=A0A8K0SMQ8_9HYPO|nr:amidase signature domain-containing protein [Stachybotrys elegans]
MQLRNMESLRPWGMNSVPGFDTNEYRWLDEAVDGLDLGPPNPSIAAGTGPCLVVRSQSADGVSDDALCQLISTWMSAGDVIHPSFCKTLFIVTGTGSTQPLSSSFTVQRKSLEDFPGLQAMSVMSITQLLIGSDEHAVNNLCSGPYVWSGTCFHRIYRSYADSQSAFFSSIIHIPEDGRFIETRPTSHVAVPSRLYSPPRAQDRPLSGLRFAVKDLIDVAGLRTSAGSRDYYKYVAESASSAQLITHLISLGAVLIGKTKNTQFANGEDPQEWIDYTCPWNPRGDGYQNPDTSSSGSATAISSYDWIDFTIGTDTCGSIACPAAAQGVFAIRLSTGAASQEGVLRMNKYLDSVGLFTRHIDVLSNITSLWLRPDDRLYQTTVQPWSPVDIVYPWSSFSHGNKETLEAHERFVQSLLSFTGATRRDLDLDREWKRIDPLTSASSVYEDLKKTTGYLHLAGFSDRVEPFRLAFKEEYGREPYLDKVNLSKLQVELT